MLGNIGEAEKRGRTRQEISKIDAATAVLETERKSEKAKADAQLTETQTRLNMSINLANIQATRQAEAKDAELQRDVETKRAEMELERRRATDVVHAKINRESAQQKADAQFYSENKNADGLFYKQTRDADAKYLATTKGADAALYLRNKELEADYLRATREADAAFYAAKKEAEGITEKAKAFAHMSEVLGGPQGLLQYMMLQNNTYEKLAKANAQAINGLQPKITVWNTGENAGGSDPAAPIRNIMQSLPPLLSTINEQTGILPPSWLANLGGQQLGEGQVAVTGKRKSGMGLTNGEGGGGKDGKA